MTERTRIVDVEYTVKDDPETKDGFVEIEAKFAEAEDDGSYECEMAGDVIQAATEHKYNVRVKTFHGKMRDQEVCKVCGRKYNWPDELYFHSYDVHSHPVRE